jgi:adenine deaminase
MLYGFLSSDADYGLDTMRPPALSLDSFRIAGVPGDARVIGVVPDQIVTKHLILPATHRDGQLVADLDRDIAKLAVIQRHSGDGPIGLGLVQGFGLRRGAMASSVAHDAHNLVVVGMNDADMHIAACHVTSSGGGVAVVAEGEVLAELALPIAGLMSPLPIEAVADALDALDAAAATLGSTLAHPLMTLSFMALSVIPTLKLTAMGLVDVDRVALVPLQPGRQEPI